jgi:hypothetical protein
MTISGITASQHSAARAAGLAGLLTMATAVGAFYGISSRLSVAGDVAATARNIMANEVLFRVSIVCFLVYCAGVVALTAALYTVLNPVSRGLAVLAFFLEADRCGNVGRGSAQFPFRSAVAGRR